MSVHFMSLVWTNAPYGGEKLLTLMAIADITSEEHGEFAWDEHACERVARRARTTVYRVDAFVRLFMVDGLIEFAAPREGTPIMRLILPAEGNGWEARS